MSGWSDSIRRTFGAFADLSPLVRRKFFALLPGIVLANVSSLILINVDGVVIGNFVSSTAFAAVALVAPVIGAIGVLVAAFGGFSTGVAIGQAIGRNDRQELRDCYRSGFVLACALAVGVAVLEVPVFRLLIGASGAGAELTQEAWAYARGMMIALVIGVMTTFGTYVLIANGKTRPLVYLTLFEGIVNLVADVGFVKFLGMGTAGAGYGTAVANIMRLGATVYVVLRETDAYRCIRFGRARSIPTILGFGRSTFIVGLVGSVSAYCMNRLVVCTLGDSGMVMKAVGDFSMTIASAVYGGVGLSVGPLLALFAGDGSYREMKKVFRFGVLVDLCLVGALAVVMALIPSVLCRLNGVVNPPDGTFAVVRFYCLFFLFAAVNKLIALCLVNLKKQMAATVLPLLEGSVMLLSFSWLFSRIDGRFLFCGYAAASAVALAIGCVVIRSVWKGLLDETRRISFDLVPETVSQTVERLLKELPGYGIPPAQATRIGIAVEETSAYLKSTGRNGDVQIHASLVIGKDKVTLSVLDDGAKVNLADRINVLATDLVYDNIGMINAISRKVNYQYVMDMNVTTLEIK